jgi:hypothetical protein
MISAHLKAHLSVADVRDVIEGEISFEVLFYCTPTVGSHRVFLVAAIKLFLHKICTVPFSLFPRYSSFSLRSYTLVDLIRRTLYQSLGSVQRTFMTVDYVKGGRPLG